VSEIARRVWRAGVGGGVESTAKDDRQLPLAQQRARPQAGEAEAFGQAEHVRTQHLGGAAHTPPGRADGLGRTSQIKGEADSGAMGRAIEGDPVQQSLVLVARPSVDRGAVLLPPVALAQSRVGHGRFENLKGGAGAGAGETGEQSAPTADPAGPVGVVEEGEGGVGHRDHRAERVPMRVVDHRCPGRLVDMGSQGGGASRQSQCPCWSRPRGPGPVLGLSGQLASVVFDGGAGPLDRGACPDPHYRRGGQRQPDQPGKDERRWPPGEERQGGDDTGCT
jgi:hypothetical protein